MLTTTLSDFRKDIKSYFDRVTESFDTLIINRGKDTGVVIMSLEEYNSLKSTQHELSSRKNQQRLDESIESLKAGKKMLLNELIPLYDRDLKALRNEIQSYPDDASLWQLSAGIANPGGNVFLHLMGNLNTFYGAVYANTGYVRDRPLEFTLRDKTRAELVAMLDEIHPIVLQVLRDFPAEKLGEIYPIKIFEEEKTVSYIFIHLETHLAYHLGQINYHRRLI